MTKKEVSTLSTQEQFGNVTFLTLPTVYLGYGDIIQEDRLMPTMRTLPG